MRQGSESRSSTHPFGKALVQIQGLFNELEKEPLVLKLSSPQNSIRGQPTWRALGLPKDGSKHVAPSEHR